MTGILIDAWLDIRSKPLRTIAAIAGMMAAVVAVILVDAASVLSHDANNQYLARQFGLHMTGSIYSEIAAPPETDAKLQAVLLGNGYTALSTDAGLTFSTPRGDAFPIVNARWVSSAYDRIRIIDLVAGSWPRTTAAALTPHIVISEAFADDLGYAPTQAIGQTIMLGPPGIGPRYDPKTTPLQLAVIDGVISTTTNAIQGEDFLLVSDLPQHSLLREGQSLAWLVRTNPDDYGALVETVTSITDAEGRPVYSIVRADQSAQVAPVLDQQGVTANAVTIVALTVGGLGILGIGLASVRERGTEFGVRRALGASKRRIFTGVMIQTVLEALIAALIAIPLAMIAVDLFTRQLVLASLPLPASRSLPVSSALQGIIGALLVGLIAGLIPAVNAARLSVVRALRG